MSLVCLSQPLNTVLYCWQYLDMGTKKNPDAYAKVSYKAQSAFPSAICKT